MKIRLLQWDAQGTTSPQVGHVAVQDDDGSYYELTLSRATLGAFMNDDGSLKNGINTAAIRTALRGALPPFRSLGTG